MDIKAITLMLPLTVLVGCATSNRNGLHQDFERESWGGQRSISRSEPTLNRPMGLAAALEGIFGVFLIWDSLRYRPNTYAPNH